MTVDLGLRAALPARMTQLSTSEIATVCGGQARAATPAESEQANRDAAAFDQDRALESHGHSVSPSAGQFWSGREKPQTREPGWSLAR